jgi:hypothetical protein
MHCPPLYSETSADATVGRINAAVTQAIDLAVPQICGKLKLRSKKKNNFYTRSRNSRLADYMTNFLSTVNSFITAINSDGLC